VIVEIEAEPARVEQRRQRGHDDKERSVCDVLPP
jgi:hypothetical protein